MKDSDSQIQNGILSESVLKAIISKTDLVFTTNRRPARLLFKLSAKDESFLKWR